MAALAPDAAGPTRARPPPEIGVVLKTLDRLYRRRRIDLVHARILRIWGLRRKAPDPARPGERSDARIWREAIDRLDWPLRQAGIVRSNDRK